MLHATLAAHYSSLAIARAISSAHSGYHHVQGRGTEETASDSTQRIEPEEEIHCEFTLTLAQAPPTVSDQSDEGIGPDAQDDGSPDADIVNVSFDYEQQHDPYKVFNSLYKADGSVDLQVVEAKIRGKTLREILTWTDVDHFNLLQKAVVYNNRALVKLLLKHDTLNESFFGFGSRHDAPLEHSLQHFRGAIHLAAFLGCVDIVEEFLDHDVALCALRGPVEIRPVNGPPNDLFRIIGYGDFSKNPRLSFQMRWLKSHPNERPVHYAICGGYPLIMKMLMIDTDDLEQEESKRSIINPLIEQDALLANLIRQAASCASYSCLSALLQEAPEALYMRDQRGWLCIIAGICHGMQFLRYLMERGFAVKLLNNVDGRNTVNALHVFYSSLPKADGTISKYSEIYDVTEFLVDLGVDVNMESKAFRSHEVADTPLHILLDNLNLVIATVNPENGFLQETQASSDIQQVYDEAVRDSIYVLLDGGFNLEKHCNTLLKRLFSNRNFLKRYARSKIDQRLVQGNYGLRNMFNIGKLLLGARDNMLLPGRREMTPSMCLTDTLRQDGAIDCVLGDRRATMMFNSCLRVLFQNGDNPNAYPFSPKEDSFLAIPLIHVCDLYLDYLCHDREVKVAKTTLVNFMDMISMLSDAGSHFTCYMNIHGQYLKHGVFDHFRKIFHTIQRHLNSEDQTLNAFRLHVVKEITATLMQSGAQPVLEEYIFRKSHLPMINSQVESCILGQMLLLGIHCSIDTPVYSHGLELISTEEFRTCLSFLLNTADHDTYYSCLRKSLAVADDEESSGIDADQTELCAGLRQLADNTRSLKALCRIVIRANTYPDIKRGYRSLPLPPELVDFIFH